MCYYIVSRWRTEKLGVKSLRYEDIISKRVNMLFDLVPSEEGGMSHIISDDLVLPAPFVFISAFS